MGLVLVPDDEPEYQEVLDPGYEGVDDEPQEVDYVEIRVDDVPVDPSVDDVVINDPPHDEPEPSIDLLPTIEVEQPSALGPCNEALSVVEALQRACLGVIEDAQSGLHAYVRPR